MENNSVLFKRRVYEMFPDITNKEWTAFRDIFVPKHVSRRTLLFENTKVAKELYFIDKGCMRQFYMIDGEEINVAFHLESQFTGPCRSFMLNEPNHQLFETLEDCVLLAMEKESFIYAIEQYPRLAILRSMIAEENLFTTESIVSMLLIHSPEQRYMFLLNNHKNLLNRIPQYMLATLLGVSPESLSRIKKRIFSRVAVTS